MACTIDFRCLDEGFGGKTYKRKRAEQAEQLLLSIQPPAAADAAASMDVDSNAPPSKRQAVPSSDNPNKPAYGNPTYDGVIAGRVSGRRWKQPRTRRSSAIHVKGATTSFEQRAKQKEVKRAYKERMVELKEEIRLNKVEKRKKREEREKRKKENVLRTGTKLQVITNPKTLKKIAKSKQRKQLKVVPDDLLNKNKNKKN
ncbi:hypothetical protein RHGRI_022691 [Rhododendron griersonianum]|uniref:Coiled-coil domain-containing protein 86 n=2 Tax=Rhododendron TaxID=4346 RepID=A0AAV6J2L6_9ERIC